MTDVAQRGDRLLVAILLNPPASSSGTRTTSAVCRAARVLGYQRFEIANLISVPTRSLTDLNALGSKAWWLDARTSLSMAIARADGLLGGWGVGGMSGAMRKDRAEQTSWLLRTAAEAGHEYIWMLGGEPRHPSRWHQFLSDKHGRAAGGTAEQRLAQLLLTVPTRTL